MNDKERILMTVISRLSVTQGLARGASSEREFKDNSCASLVHFACYDDRKVQEGDLVLCQTGRIDDFKVGFVHRVVGHANCIIREIGTNNLCNYSNERFVRIIGIDPEYLLEGEQYRFKVKVLKAFRRGDEFMYLYGGIEFPKDRVAVIYVRERYGGLTNPSKPFTVRMQFTTRTTIKAVLEALREGGYGTREFELVDQGGEE